MIQHNKKLKLNAIIVDDELFGRENLKQIIETYCSEIEILGAADSVVSAKELIKKTNPDVVFLDISMPTLDGFDFIKEYSEPDFMIVFVSAHEEYGIKAVKAGVTDYLLKPIDIKELKETVNKLLTIHKKNETVQTEIQSDKIVIPASHGVNIIEYTNIVRLEADGSYTKVFIKEQKCRWISRTLKDFEDTLPKEKFCRVHKSHIINIKYIKDYKNISGYEVTMTDGSKIEISRRKAPEFIRKIKAVLNSV